MGFSGVADYGFNEGLSSTSRQNFTGLWASNYTGTVLDGNANEGSWWNAVGVNTSWPIAAGDGIPGPSGKQACRNYLYNWKHGD